MIVSPRVTLAVLITLSIVTDILVTSSTLRRGKQNRRRVHKQRKRPRFGRQEDLITTTTTSAPILSPLPAPGVERYDLTSYGQAQLDAPAIAYGAPGPEDDINDGYTGDLPGAGSGQVTGQTGGREADQDYDDRGPGAASDTGDQGGAAAAEGIPPWCNPTDPMGAWLNHQKIQAGTKLSLFSRFVTLHTDCRIGALTTATLSSVPTPGSAAERRPSREPRRVRRTQRGQGWRRGGRRNTSMTMITRSTEQSSVQ